VPFISTSQLASHESSNKRNSEENIPLKEPDNQYGRMTYWDESYRQALNEPNGEDEAIVFSWYSGWQDIQPFFTELTPLQDNPRILVPGIGNDGCIRDMFDYGYKHLSAFDYAPEGVECAKQIMGERVQLMDDLRVADCRELPYDDSSFDVVSDKGTLDSIYLSGGMDKVLSGKHLGMAVSELRRVLKPGGIMFSVTAACVDSIQKSFDECNMNKEAWEQLRDGSLYITEDGYTSNNVDATVLVWKKI
jgi:SAM-dependent methyltransferase